MSGEAVVSQEPVIDTPVVQTTSAQETPMAEVVKPSITQSVGNEEIEQRLVEVVVKHTGYPADFIEMDQDVEGELGIDTVKQAEIMAEVRDIFSPCR